MAVDFLPTRREGPRVTLLGALTMLVELISTLALATLAVARPAGPLKARWANVSTTVVDLGYAQYQGTYDPDTNISYFFGIRYAQAPTGGYYLSVLIRLILSELYKGICAGVSHRHLRSLLGCSKRRPNQTNAIRLRLATRARILSGHRHLLRRGPYPKMRIASS